MPHFIRWYDGALAPDICKDIIARFEADDRKMVGMVSGNQGAEVDLKGK